MKSVSQMQSKETPRSKTIDHSDFKDKIYEKATIQNTNTATPKCETAAQKNSAGARFSLTLA